MSRIQVDPGSALSIMPRRVMQHLGIPTHRLSATQTIIFGFNANGTRLMGKIKLKCQIGNLRSEVSRIQVDPGSALSVMPRRFMHHLEIPTHRLSATQTTIYGFNANGTRPMGKIKVKCQIGDLRSEVTCYIIDATLRTICCSDNRGFIVIPSSLPLSIKS